MKIAAIGCNIVLFGFTGFLIIVEPPQGAAYVAFSFLLLLVPIISVAALARFSLNTAMKIVAVISNMVAFGFTCWANVDQYPHSREGGVIAFTVLIISTQIVSLLALFRGLRPGGGIREREMIS